MARQHYPEFDEFRAYHVEELGKMTLEQYKAKLDEELKAMDWHERDIKNSRAYKVLSAAALDRENVPMEEWLKLNAYFYRRVKELQG